MFALEFNYHKASSVAEAIELLNANGGAKLIATGPPPHSTRSPFILARVRLVALRKVARLV